MMRMIVTSRFKVISLVLYLCAFSILAQDPGSNNQQGSDNQKDDPIKIGLLISDSSSVEARYGAEFAARQINQNGGIDGRRLKILTRSMEGPWGKGSKQAVDLIFDEKVWAILGLHEGRNAHLVEQVIAKTKIVFLSAWAADPTLSQAFVPWYFSSVPNSEQQAKVIVEELAAKQGMTPLLIVSEKGYDSTIAYENFIKSMGQDQVIALNHLNIEKSQDFQRIKMEIQRNNAKTIVLFGEPDLSWQLIHFLRSDNINLPVYASLSLLGEKAFDNLNNKNYQNVFLINNGNWMNKANRSFTTSFNTTYGWCPGAMAAYANDGVLLLAEAIERSELDRKNLQKSISETNFKGMTGSIRFDARGNRTELPNLVEINLQNLCSGKP